MESTKLIEAKNSLVVAKGGYCGVAISQKVQTSSFWGYNVQRSD